MLNGIFGAAAGIATTAATLAGVHLGADLAIGELSNTFTAAAGGTLGFIGAGLANRFMIVPAGEFLAGEKDDNDTITGALWGIGLTLGAYFFTVVVPPMLPELPDLKDMPIMQEGGVDWPYMGYPNNYFMPTH